MSHAARMHGGGRVIIDGHAMHYSCVMSDAPPQDFADLIASARKAKDWSQDKLSDESGVDRSTISRWERRLTDKPEPEHVRAVCAALGIDPRQAAVALGFLTADESEPVKPLPSKLQQVVDVLEDPRLTREEVDQWVAYLLYLRSKKDTSSPAN